MTVELIQIGKEDTNDYEQSLHDFGYTDLGKKVKEDVIAVWKFFCNEELVLRGLKKFVTEYFLFNQKEKRSLRQFFDDWGSKNHFNAPNTDKISEEFKTSPDFQYPKHTPVLYGELTADLFKNVLLQNGYLSADVGAGPTHGKWAHSIQFFLLEEARKEGILQLHSQSICQFVQTISQIKGPFEALSLWDILFDSFEEHIFTYPNNITRILSSAWDTSEAAKFLAAKLNAFEEKFNWIAKDEQCYDGYAKQKYLSRLNEASYIFYKEKCALLWFASKDKEEPSNSADLSIRCTSLFVS
ncbi:TPA: LirA/MavJ family T4SS effector [Legionella anisa]